MKTKLYLGGCRLAVTMKHPLRAVEFLQVFRLRGDMAVTARDASSIRNLNSASGRVLNPEKATRARVPTGGGAGISRRADPARHYMPVQGWARVKDSAPLLPSSASGFAGLPGSRMATPGAGDVASWLDTPSHGTCPWVGA